MLKPVQGRHGQRFVYWAAAFQLAGKNDDFIDAGDTADVIGVLADDFAQLAKAAIAAHAA